MRLVLASLIVLALLSASGLVPSGASAQPAGCAEALARDGVRWDGLPMEGYVWEGATIDLEPIAALPIVVCIAGGEHRMVVANGVGCVMVGGTLALVGDRLACGAFRWMEREGDDTLLWVAHDSAATVYVARFLWNGGAFDPAEPYLACGDRPAVPIRESEECLRRGIPP